MTADEIKATLDRHTRYLRGFEAGKRANFCRADIRGCEMRHANLHYARFVDVNAAGANFSHSDFSYASFERANLSGACLSRADMFGTFFRGADCSRASFAMSYLANANFTDANCEYVDFTGSRLVGVNMCKANIRHANLTDVLFERMEWYGACLDGARINWDAPELVAELLKRAACDEPDRLQIAGTMHVARTWTWARWTDYLDSHPLRQWVIDALSPWVQDGDNAPAILRASTTATQEVLS